MRASQQKRCPHFVLVFSRIVIHTKFHLNHIQNPLSARNALNNASGQIFYCVAQTVYNIFQRLKNFVLETSFSDFFPYLLYWIHFGSIGRYMSNMDIIRDLQTAGFMPPGAVTNHQNDIIRVFFG